MSGGYAGAKATIRFISAYAGAESERNSLDIQFVAVLPKLTPVTGLGSTFIDAYADYDNIDRDTFRERLGEPLTADQVADDVGPPRSSRKPARTRLSAHCRWTYGIGMSDTSARPTAHEDTSRAFIDPITPQPKENA